MLRRSCSAWLIFSICVALGIPRAGRCSFLTACEIWLKETFPNALVLEQRVRAVLPTIKAENLERWRIRASTTPESKLGLSEGEALRLLSSLKNLRDPSRSGIHIRNATYRVPLPEDQKAIVKQRFRRSDLFEGRAVHITNDPLYDVEAFVLDRKLGINLVAPAMKLNEDTAAILFIEGAAPIKPQAAQNDPASFVEMTHVRMLDLLLGNFDRSFSDNLLRLDGKLVAIDFDLCRPSPSFPVEAAEYSLRAAKFGKLRNLPGVFAKSVLVKLRALNHDLLSEPDAYGNVLRENTITSILGTRDAILHVIDHWKAKFGDEIIELREL